MKACRSGLATTGPSEEVEEVSLELSLPDELSSSITP